MSVSTATCRGAKSRATDVTVDFVRTPDERFADLPDWPYEPRYVDVDGLRMAYVDEGPRDGTHDPAPARRADVGLPVPADAADAPRRRLPHRCSRPHRVRPFGQADRAGRLHLRRSRRLDVLVRRAARPPGHRAVRPGLGWPDRAARRRRAPWSVRPPRARQHVPARRRAGGGGLPAVAAGEPGDAVPRRRQAVAAGDARPSAQRCRGRGVSGAVPRRGAHGRGAAVPATGADRA